MKALRVLGLCLVWATVTWAGETGYVSDSIEITVRTGPGMDRKIFTMIRSGQALEILETQNDWTHIRLPSGREGWVLTRFVTTRVPATVRLAELETTHQRLLEKAEAPVQELARLEAQNQALESSLNEAREEAGQLASRLAEVQKNGSANPGLRAAYRRSAERVSQQQKRLATLEESLAQASRATAIWWFLTGAGVLFVGFLLGLVSRSKRRRSSLL